MCILYCTFSDLTYVASFMSENLYLPLGLWATYITSHLIDMTVESIENKKNISNKKYYLYSTFTGIFYYVVYICKEVGLVFPFTYLLFLLSILLWKKHRHVKIDNIKTIILHAILVLASFTMLYLLFRYVIVFGNNAKNYSVTTDVLSQSFNYYYIYYGLAYFSFMTVIAYGVFPVVLPIIQNRNMEITDRYFYAFLCLMILICGGVVAYTITAVEDWAETTPRLHLRYICYMFLPMVIMMLNSFEHTVTVERKTILRTSMALCVILIYLTILSGNQIVPQLQILDQTMLKYLSENASYQLIIVIVYSLCVIGITALLIKDYKKGTNLILTMLLVLNVANTCISNRTWRSDAGNAISDELLNAGRKTDEYLKTHANKNFLMIGNIPYDNVITTYASENNLYMLNANGLETYLSSNQDRSLSWMDVMENVQLMYFKDYYYVGINEIDYIITADDLKIDFDLSEINSEYDDITGVKIYELKDTNTVPKLTYEETTTNGIEGIDQQIDDALKKAYEKRMSESNASTSE